MSHHYELTQTKALQDIAASLRDIAGHRDSVGVDELRIALDDATEGDWITNEEVAAALLERFDIKRKVGE